MRKEELNKIIENLEQFKQENTKKKLTKISEQIEQALEKMKSDKITILKFFPCVMLSLGSTVSGYRRESEIFALSLVWFCSSILIELYSVKKYMESKSTYDSLNVQQDSLHDEIHIIDEQMAEVLNIMNNYATFPNEEVLENTLNDILYQEKDYERTRVK